MGCQAFCLPRCCPDEQMLCLPRISENSNCTAIGSVGCNVVIRIMRAGYGRLACHQISSGTYPLHRKLLRAYSNPVGLVEQSSPESLEIEDEKTGSIHSTDEALAQPPSSDELKSLLMDTERSKLIKKLSEANQQNRFLKRQLQGNDNALVTFKSELAILEQEIQMLHALADEIVKAGIPEGTRKINGKYIHSHLLSRLEAVQKKLQDQIKDVDVAQSKEVLVFWIGMAEFGTTY